MTEVLPFKKPTKPEPEEFYVVGKARCLDCKHEWEATAPAGVYRLECPACGTERGMWTQPVSSRDGLEVWTCAECRSPYWEIRADRTILCVCCGNVGAAP